MKPGLVAPISLGCCPHEPRCILCPPPPVQPTPAFVAAMIHAAREGSPGAGAPEVRFFGGAPPSDALLDAAAGHRILVRVRPDLLSRADALRLRGRGVHAIELDAVSFDTEVLREAARRHRPARVVEMSSGLRALGFEVGGVLVPGLPRSHFALAVDDARRAAELWSFARIHPALVLEGSGLRTLHEQRRYDPLDLGAAITVVRAMLDVLEPAGVNVVRVGLQPGPDGFGRAVAGPYHSGFRELVEARRAQEKLRDALGAPEPGAHAVVACAPADETRTRGHQNQNVRTLRADLRLSSLSVVADPTLTRGAVRVTFTEEIG